MDNKQNTDLIRTRALELGFSYCGFAKAEFLKEEEANLNSWIKNGYHANMSWMENNMELRLDPRKVELWAKSVICLMINYFPQEDKKFESSVQISKYAWGRDYHNLIRSRMKTLTRTMRDEIGDISARGFVDSGPLMEKAWARRSGVGWIGKNSLTLVKRGGSFYFLGIILTDLELEYDKPLKQNYCGSCTLCIDACPTQAIVKPAVIDAHRCLSYLSIEHKEEIPKEFIGKSKGWIFGCDICQDVCPHNKRYSIAHQEPDFTPPDSWFHMKDKDWQELELEVFNILFKGTPVMRAGYRGLKKNLKFVFSDPR